MAEGQAKKSTTHKTFSIQVTVVSIFLFATLFTVSIAIGLQFYFSKQMAHEHALNSFSINAKTTSQFLNKIDRQARNAVELLSTYTPITTDNMVNNHVNTLFSGIMRNNLYFYSIYVGFPNGDYYEVVNLDAHNTIRQKVSASDEDRWVVVEIRQEGDNRKRTFSYYDDTFTLRSTREEETQYIATKRPWYMNAKHDLIHQTEPYLFQNIQSSGQTYSSKISGTDTVVAVDVVLSSISQYIEEQKQQSVIDTESEIYLYTHEGEIIASGASITSSDIPASKTLSLTEQQKNYIKALGVLKVSNEMNWAPVDYAVAGEPQGYNIDMLTLIEEMTDLSFEFVNGFSWTQLLDKFSAGDIHILHSIVKTPYNQSLGLFSDALLSLPLSVVTQSHEPNITQISQLAHKTLAIPKGWSIIPVIEAQYPEIKIVIVDSTKDLLEFVQNKQVYAGLDNGDILTYTAKQHFINNLQYHENISLASEKMGSDLRMLVAHEKPQLLSILNMALANISEQQKAALHEKWFDNALDNKRAQSTVPYQAMLTLPSNAQNHNTLVVQRINGEDYYIYISPVNSVKDYYFSILVPVSSVMDGVLDKINYSIIVTLLCLLLVLPICWWFSKPIIKPIKLLEAENKKIMKRDFDGVKRIYSHITELDDLAQSLVDMSQSIKQYQLEQKELMESIIQLIAQAIDDKSAYTAGHCNRVPELGIMLANVAASSNIDAFKSFTFHNEDEVREFKIAAWLHDCGKIITPEHIVDKGSKLETIYNRIHEIRMRFEVLRRDAHILYYEKLTNATEQSAEFIQGLQDELATRYAQLEADYAFVATNNVGSENIAEEDVVRLHKIAEQTWLRYFDDQVGLSPVEEMQLAGESKALPAVERLLANKPEHIVERTKNKTYDPKFGIKVKIPEYEANKGEIYNLSIARGTLTEEDRFTINEHIIGTIKMLDSVPFPPELSRVPRYASTHHETLKGTGYPRQLNADDLSIPERILVLADIFEALTAADRPYKKAKPLSVSLNILHNMAKDNHVDMDVFKLFLSSGVYKVYAEKFLKPEQIDEVDITALLNGE